MKFNYENIFATASPTDKLSDEKYMLKHFCNFKWFPFNLTNFTQFFNNLNLQIGAGHT